MQCSVTVRIGFRATVLDSEFRQPPPNSRLPTSALARRSSKRVVYGELRKAGSQSEPLTLDHKLFCGNEFRRPTRLGNGFGSDKSPGSHHPTIQTASRSWKMIRLPLQGAASHSDFAHKLNRLGLWRGGATCGELRWKQEIEFGRCAFLGRSSRRRSCVPRQSAMPTRSNCESVRRASIARQLSSIRLHTSPSEHDRLAFSP